LPYIGHRHNDAFYDNRTFKFGAGMARDGSAIWQNAGMMATVEQLIFF
jgi:hypothetical protein